MFFFISFNYSTLRVIKDTLVVNAPGGAGGAVIPPLKFCTFAAAIFFMSMYIKLAGRVSKQKLFYLTLTPFLSFFVLFPTVLYPLSNVIHLNSFGEWATLSYQQVLKVLSLFSVTGVSRFSISS